VNNLIIYSYAVKFIEKEKYTKTRLEESIRIIQIQWLWKKKKCSLAYKHDKIKISIKKLRKIKRNIAKVFIYF
jgi:hypothetical protein